TLSRSDASISAGPAFRKNQDRCAVTNHVRGFTQRFDGRVRVLSIYRHMAGPAQMPAEKWIPEQLFLGGESELERQGGKNNGSVHVALVIHAKHVRCAGLDVFQSRQPDSNSRCPQD